MSGPVEVQLPVGLARMLPALIDVASDMPDQAAIVVQDLRYGQATSLARLERGHPACPGVPRVFVIGHPSMADSSSEGTA